MTNQEFFENYGTEKWAIEQNLCFLLQGYWEEVRKCTGAGSGLPVQMPLNPVSYVKKFMKEETIVEVKWAERSKMDTVEKGVVVEGEFRELE